MQAVCTHLAGLVLTLSTIVASLSMTRAGECSRIQGPFAYPLPSHANGGEFIAAGRGEFGGQDGEDRVLVIPTSSQTRKLVRIDGARNGHLSHTDLFEFAPRSSFYSESLYLFGDVTGDGFDDVLDLRESIVRLHAGNGRGAFAPVRTESLPTTIRYDAPPVLADIDGNDTLELVAIGDLYFSTMRAYRHAGDLGWISRGFSYLTWPPRKFFPGDYNGDGIVDIAYAGDFGFTQVHFGDPQTPLNLWWRDQLPPGTALVAGFDAEHDGRAELFVREFASARRLARLDWVETPLPRLQERWRKELPPGAATILEVVDLDSDLYTDLAAQNMGADGRTFGFQLLRGGAEGFELAYRSSFDWRFAGAILVDADELTDVVFSEPLIGFSWLAATSSGSYDEGVRLVPTDRPGYQVLGGDLNHDLRLDLVHLFSGGGEPLSLKSTVGYGDGQFSAVQTRQQSRSTFAERLLDINYDGTLDLFTAGTGSPLSLEFSLGRGDGSFQPAIESPGPNRIVSIEVGNSDGDRWSDLLIETSEWPNDRWINVLQLYRGSAIGFAPGARWEIGNSGSSAKLGDVDGDGRDDLIAVKYGSDQTPFDTARIQWRRSLAGDELGPIEPFTQEVFPNQLKLTAAHLNGDRFVDLLVTQAPSVGPLSYRVIVGDGGAGNPPTTWEGLRLDRYIFDALHDVDGDGVLDLVESTGRFTVRRGTGLGSFGVAAGSWLAGPRQPWESRSFLGDVAGRRKSDVLTTRRDYDRWSHIVSLQAGQTAKADENPPEVELWPLPELGWDLGIPSWAGRWQLAGRAIDDCRSAHVDSLKLVLPPLQQLSAVLFTASDGEAIHIYQSVDKLHQYVVLRGPDQAAIESRFANTRDHGLEIPRFHSFWIDESTEPGSTPADESDPELPDSEATLIYSIAFVGDLPERVRSFAPLAGVEVELSAVDWLGKRSIAREFVNQAHQRICATTKEPNSYACQ